MNRKVSSLATVLQWLTVGLWLLATCVFVYERLTGSVVLHAFLLSAMLGLAGLLAIVGAVLRMRHHERDAE
jgi:hypothetical protein